MVRLVVLFAPAACVLSGIGISSVLRAYMENLEMDGSAATTPTTSTKGSKLKRRAEVPMRSEFATIMVFITSVYLVLFGFHCTWTISGK